MIEDEMWANGVADYRAASADGIRGPRIKRKEKYVRQDANLQALLAESSIYILSLGQPSAPFSQFYFTPFFNDFIFQIRQKLPKRYLFNSKIARTATVPHFKNSHFMPFFHYFRS